MRHSLKLLLTTTVLTVSSSFAADQPLLPNSSNDATDSSVVTAEKQGVSPMKHSKVLELFRSVPSPFFGFFPKNSLFWVHGWLDVSNIIALTKELARGISADLDSARKKLAFNETDPDLKNAVLDLTAAQRELRDRLEPVMQAFKRIRIGYTKISFFTNHDDIIRFLGFRPSGNNSDEGLELNEALGNINITFWNDSGSLILEGARSLLCHKPFTPEHSKNHHPLALNATSLNDTLQSIINLGYPAAAAETYELIALSNATPDAILNEAWKTSRLDGTVAEKIEFRRRAANLYEIAATHRDATPKDILEAATKIAGLDGTDAEKIEFRPRTANLYKIAANHRDATPGDILEAATKIAGLDGTDAEKIEFRRRAANLYEIAANHRDVTHRGILEAATKTARLDGTDDEKSTFYMKAENLFLQYADNPNVDASDIRHAAFDIGVKFDFQTRTKICKLGAAHAKATPDQISLTAYSFEDKDPVTAKELYELIPNHKDATFHDIYCAASRINILYDKDTAVKLYIQSANHPKATSQYISYAADSIAKLDGTNDEKIVFRRAAAKLYTKSANHTDVSPNDIFMAARGFENIDDKRTARKLYKLSADVKTASPYYIRQAADSIAALNGTKTAIEVYKLIPNHPDASPHDILSAASGIAKLGAKKKAATLYKKTKDIKDVKVQEIMTAADSIAKLGYTNTAMELYKKTIPSLSKTPGELRRTADRIASLGDKDAAITLYVKSANHTDVSPDDILRAAEAVAKLGDKITALRLFIDARESCYETCSDMDYMYLVDIEAATLFEEDMEDSDLTLLIQILAGPNAPEDFIKAIRENLSEKLRHNYDDKINALRNRVAPLNR